MVTFSSIASTRSHREENYYSFVAEVHYSSLRFLFSRGNNNSVAGRCTGARIKGWLFCIIVEPCTDGVIKKWGSFLEAVRASKFHLVSSMPPLARPRSCPLTLISPRVNSGGSEKEIENFITRVTFDARNQPCFQPALPPRSFLPFHLPILWYFSIVGQNQSTFVPDISVINTSP